MNRFLIGTATLVGGLLLSATSALAQSLPVGGSGVGTTITTQSFNSRIFSTSESWGDFSDLGITVNAGNSAGGGLGLNIDTSNPSGGLGITTTAGGIGGLNLYTIDGGFYNFTRANTNVTGQSVTAETFFK